MGFRSKTSNFVMLLEIIALKVTGAFAGEAPAGTSKFFPGQLGWHWTLGSYRIQMCFLSQLQKMLMYKTEFIALEEVSVTS